MPDDHVNLSADDVKTSALTRTFDSLTAVDPVYRFRVLGDFRVQENSDMMRPQP
jgi:hypothetical protein